MMLLSGLVPLASACGSAQSGSSTPAASTTDLLELVAGSANKTQKAGSARVKVRMSITAQGTTMDASASGVFEFRPARGRLVFRMSGLPGVGTLRMEEILDGTVVYMRAPMLTAQIPGAKPWLKIDLERAGELGGVDLGGLMQAADGQNDPTQWMQYLRGVRSIKRVGEEVVRGTATTRYSIEVDYRRMLDGVPAETREQLKPTLERLGQMLSGEPLPMEVWLDGRGTLRRISMSYEMSDPSAGKIATEITADYYDFGVKVDVAPPPASRTTDLIDLLRSAGAL